MRKENKQNEDKKINRMNKKGCWNCLQKRGDTGIS